MIDLWSLSRSLFAGFPKRLLNVLVVIGLMPSLPVGAAIDADLLRRTEDIRQRLLEADAAAAQRPGAQAAAPQGERLAGWYNFPNFPNWANWNKWPNYWRNF